MYVVMDIGGTSVRIARTVSLTRPLAHRFRVCTFRTPCNYADARKRIVETIREMAAGRVRGIGVAVAGTVNRDRGMIVRSPNLPDWNGHALARDLSRTFRCPVKMENDAAAAALGEAVYGRGEDGFLFLVWGTGIGGTQIFRRGRETLVMPFEPGHQMIPCEGRSMEWERAAGGRGVIQRLGHPNELTTAQWRRVREAFLTGLVNLLNIRPSRTVVLAGGMVTMHPVQVRMIVRDLRRDARLAVEPPKIIRVSTFGEVAGLMGAAALLTPRGKRHVIL